MKCYKTSEIAKLTGIHPNTVRLYETWGFLSPPERKENGYRIFTEKHLEQIRFARLTLRGEVLQKGLRKKAIEIIRLTAQDCYEEAISLTEDYLSQLTIEHENAQEAVKIAAELLRGRAPASSGLCLTRSQAAAALEVTPDTLRNWERNGLFSVPRRQNGYRTYDENDLRTLKLIRTLRSADYALSAIVRMLHALSENPEADIQAVLDTPSQDEFTPDAITACDQLITALTLRIQDARAMLIRLEALKERF